MESGDEIEVTFHNVRVNQGVGSEGEDAYLTVRDSIVGSETVYIESAKIRVMPPKLGDVTVGPKEVPSSGVVDLDVEYIATDTWKFGKIMVELPEEWRDSDVNDIHDERQYRVTVTQRM